MFCPANGGGLRGSSCEHKLRLVAGGSSDDDPAILSPYCWLANESDGGGETPRTSMLLVAAWQERATLKRHNS